MHEEKDSTGGAGGSGGGGSPEGGAHGSGGGGLTPGQASGWLVIGAVIVAALVLCVTGVIC